jgi:glucose-1-phosphate cytidylyltransferase
MTNDKIKKVVIFCGGQGTRLGELTEIAPKPLVKVGEVPILIHIMRSFYHQGYKEFFLLLGYKSEEFKKFFRDYSFFGSNITFAPGGSLIHQGVDHEDWTVHRLETGLDSTTGQRLHLAREYIGNVPFFLTYGDSLSDVSLKEIEKKHFDSNKVATITAIPVEEKFGILETDGVGTITRFAEKSNNAKQLINGGYIACDPTIFDHVNAQSGDFSFEALTELAKVKKLGYHYYKGFWQAMDSKKDHDKLNQLYVEQPELFRGKK